MLMRNRVRDRRGTVMVLFAISLMAIIAFMALAIDLGMLALARTQCQDAADAAAMAGARTLNGVTTGGANNNYANVTPNAIAAVTANSVLGKSLSSSQVTLQIGRYSYVSADQQFEGQFPGPSTQNWSLVQAQIAANVTNQLPFSKVFNFTGGNIQTTATAVQRPRDIMIVLDYSGSMRFSSLLGVDYATATRTTNNPDSVFPTWGHYSSGSAGLQASTFTSPYDAANISTTTSDGRPPIIQDFYQDSSGTAAWSAAPSSYGTTPGGDPALKVNKNGGATYATCAADLLNYGSPTSNTRDATFETSGYAAYGMEAGGLKGYTQGPGYWGKTFFQWPPDPTNDWRKLYFTYPGTSTAMDDNSRLWDSNGNWLAPSASTYAINYAAILNWLQNIGPNPFPSTMRSGRIVYWTSIPSTIDTSSFPPSDLNQRFWKDYIDYALGLIQLSSNSWEVINNGNGGTYSGSGGEGGYGVDFTFGTVKITAKSALTKNVSQNAFPYMHYGDNPLRPKLHFWFGPLSMVDCLGNYNVWYDVSPSCSRFCWWPGTCHEAPMYACKLGIQAALTDIQNNHPNDYVAMSMFSVPQSSASDNSGTRFNRVRVGLGQNYQSMKDSLWYPPNTVIGSQTTVTPYDSNNLEVPRAMGGTCYAMPLMQAYNQFSANSTLAAYNPGAPPGDAGGNGRKGAQKIIIFETDGAPNTNASGNFTTSTAYNCYYNIRYNSSNPSASEFPFSINGYSDNSSTVTNQINSICTQICALDSASPPGYSTASKKVQIHCLGFGPQFAPTGSTRTANIATLNAMQTIGNVTDNMPSYKIIYGSQATIVTSLQQAFTQILQSGVQVSLIQ